MPHLVTLHVFSGRPDPQWLISDDEAAELQAMVATEKAGIAATGLSHLGYRGFSVHATQGGEEPRAIFRAQIARGKEIASHSIAGLPEIEHFLLWTGRDHVEDHVAAHVQPVIVEPRPAVIAPPKAVCPPCKAVDAPVYNPAFWNTPQRQPYNNCYNYANDQATNTFAQPGRATGHMYTSLNCSSVGAGAVSDGLRAFPNFTAALPAGHGWYVALVIWPNTDYHWYRQDKVGCWSHKPGGTAAHNTDNSGHLIGDPRTCNRGPYTVFCTFMITHRGVHIR